MAASLSMPRPKIEGLARFQLRLLKTQLDALDAAVLRERSAGRLSMTTTDAIREACDLWLAAHPAPKKRAKKGGAQ